MPVEEVTFYDINGEEVNLTNLVNQMIDLYEQKLELGETKLTDFNEGSEIRNILHGFAVLMFNYLEDINEAGKLPFISTSYGAYLDKIGENPFIALDRETGSVSEGEATFTLAEVQETDVTIPAGTLLTDVNELDYVTEHDAVITAGETSTIVVVSCLTEGYDGNIQVGELTTISDPEIDTDLVSVTNNVAFINGATDEDDEEYRIRLLEYVQTEGFGSLPYYGMIACDVPGVHDVKFVDETGYTRKILVNGYQRPTPNSVLAEVLALFSDVSNKILDHNFNISAPTVEGFALTFDLDVTSEYDEDFLKEFITTVVIGGSFEQMVFPGLNIGENLTRDMLVNSLLLLGNISDITSIRYPYSSDEFDTTDINEKNVVYLYSININQTVV